MKVIFLFLLLSFIIVGKAKCADSTDVNFLHPHKINLFSLADVRLLDGEFKHIMELDHD